MLTPPIHTPTIHTPRITLRPGNIQDAPAMYKNWATDPQVTRFLRWNPHKSVEETIAFLTRVQHSVGCPNTFDWLLTHQHNGEPFGTAGIFYNQGRQVFEMGYCLMQAAWGQGLATEGAQAILEFATTQLKQTQIFAMVAKENPNSARVLEKIGFAQIGEGEDAQFDGTEYPCYFYMYEISR